MQCSCQTNILSPMKLIEMRCACFLVDQVHHGGGEKAEAALVDQLHENPLGRVQRPGQGGRGVGAPAQGGGPPGEEEIIKCVGVEINYTEETEQSRSEKRLRKSYNLYFFPLLEEILYQRVWH